MPKNFVQYNRYERGINTRVDDTDIDVAALAECDGWDINTPGEIRTLANRADINDLEFNVTDPDDGTTIVPVISGNSQIVVRSDYSYASPAQAQSAGNTMLFFANNDGDVGLITDVEGTPAYSGIVMNSTSAAAVNPSFFWFEGVLRTSNPEHDSSMKPQWFGILDRTRFSSTDTRNVLAKVWTQEASALIAPSSSDIDRTNNGNGVVYVNVSADKYPNTDGHPPNIILSQSVDTEDGQWSSTRYEFGMSYVYEGNQESTITSMLIEDESGALQGDYKINLRQYFTGVKIFVATAAGAGDFPLRQTGCRVYIKKSNGGSRWRLFLDADFRRGIRSNTFDRFTNAWYRNADGQYTVTSAITMISPSIETYEGFTGVVNDEVAVSFQDDGHSWGDAEAVGRRVFYSGCKYYIGDGGTSVAQLHDRIFYSMGGKPDVVPPSNWIDLGINDGDEFIALKSFAGRLLAFKRNKIYVVNVSHPSPMGWAVEQEIDNNGVLTQSAVIGTRYGIIWANSYGCFLFSGKQPQEISGTIGSSEWKAFLAGDVYILGFDTKLNKLVVSTANPSGNDTSLSNTWTYNFELQGWQRHIIDLRDKTNGFYNKQDGSLCYFTHDVTALKYRSFKVSNNLGGISSYIPRKFTLRDDTLKIPGIKKRFYRVLVTMKNEASTVITMKMNGTTAESKSIGSANVDFVTKIFTPSSVIEAESMQLEFWSTGAGGVAISNILLEYRPKRLRQGEEGV
jgi:hypothetical protein